MKVFNFACTAIGNAVLLLLLHLGVATASFTANDLVVEAGELGPIQGKLATTIGTSTRDYISFLGMPYAEPPTGPRRFLPSIPRTGRLNETGTFEATSAGPICMQPVAIPGLPGLPEQSEDCLKINVHTPQIGNDTHLLPVIFYIHGGAFTVGYGNMYNGNRLLNRDVVLVTFNYRLGVLGFLYLDTKDAPGNAGLYDIIDALKWTNKYIQHFGGDPNKITIAGQSAGSVAVTHLVASPAAKGLFHGAIGASGTGLAAWGTAENPMDESLRIAELSGCYNPEVDGPPNDAVIANIADCMKNTADRDTLVLALMSFQIEERQAGRLGFAAVSPSLQLFPDSPDIEKILTVHPKAVFESGNQSNVPLMMGATRHDGSYVLGVFYNRFLKDNQLVNNTEFMSQQAIPAVLQALGIPNEYGVYDSISKMYVGDSRKSGNFWEMYPGLIDLFSVFFFKASAYQTALFHSNLNSNTFWYGFDYKGKDSLFNLLFAAEPVPFNGGITHSDDMIYVFEATFLGFSEEESRVCDRMVDYWANFATFGNPTPSSQSTTPTWLPLTTDQAHFMSIDAESHVLQHYDDMWNDIGWEVLPGVTRPPTGSTESLPTSPDVPDDTSVTVTNNVPSSTTGGGGGSTISNRPTVTVTQQTTSAISSSQPTSPETGSVAMIISCKHLIVFLFSLNILCLQLVR